MRLLFVHSSDEKCNNADDSHVVLVLRRKLETPNAGCLSSSE
jgi:hypothetical protein